MFKRDKIRILRGYHGQGGPVPRLGCIILKLSPNRAKLGALSAHQDGSFALPNSDSL